MIKKLLRPLEIYILSIAFFFSISFDRRLTPFSYFAKTASVVVSDTAEHGVCATDVLRDIRIFNGFVILDIFGLTLLRTVGLVNS